MLPVLSNPTRTIGALTPSVDSVTVPSVGSGPGADATFRPPGFVICGQSVYEAEGPAHLGLGAASATCTGAGVSTATRAFTAIARTLV
jgi:hypothetical protein